MAKDKKLVEQITARDVDFAQWYTDIVTKAELADYSCVRGCMVIRPYGYAIWENMKQDLDRRFKATGHENVAMPMFIPESLLQKEKDHVQGFAPEVAWVTHGGDALLPERLCVRPTSETLFCDHYARIIQSYRDLPKLYNQWCSVVRWEKTTRPFLRTMEFFWQEGHTVHETAEEAIAETERMLNVYADFLREVLAIPVIKGRKTDKEKFAGAEMTYTVEALMHDGKALQSGTSHYFGDGFARAFGIQFSDRENKLQYCHETSWGMSTRVIGAMIMVHSDDSGLVLPPRVAPVQIMLIPIAMHKDGVLPAVFALRDRLQKASYGFRVKVDSSDKMPGWKFSEQEMRGIPLRLEMGPRDIEQGSVVAVRRDTGAKTILPLEGIEDALAKLLDEIHADMLARAEKHLAEHCYKVTTYDEFKDTAANRPGFIEAAWCGDVACEEQIKADTGATSRCMPFSKEQPDEGAVCVCCGRPAKHNVYWGKAY